MIKNYFFLFLALLLISCTQVKENQNNDQLLYIWMHDIGFDGPNFLSVVDADADSENYGRLIDTVPVYETVGMAHHTPLFLPSSGLIYANDFHNSHTYIYDTSDPWNPRITNSFGKTDKYSFPHSYSELPNGNIITTFQTKGGINSVGGLVEFSAEGKYLRSSDAEVDETIFMRPYGIVLVPKLNKIITTNYDMHETGNGYHIQIWDMTSLELLQTLKLPSTKDLIIDQNPFEGRLLADGETVMFQTFSCGLYTLENLNSSTPTISYVHHFAEGPFCSLPVRLKNYWIQTVASDSGGFNGIVVLDISEPSKPFEIDRLDTGSTIGPHWLSPNANGDKIVLTGFFEQLERRVMMLNFNQDTGQISIDNAFGEGDKFGSGLIIDRESWPHGDTGAAMAHGAIFWPPAPPDWMN